MNPLYVGLGVVAAVLAVVVLLLLVSPKARVVAKATVAPASPILAPSHEQLLARLVTPAFEDAVDKKRSKRLYDSMLASYIEQRHPDEVDEPPPAPAAKVLKPVA